MGDWLEEVSASSPAPCADDRIAPLRVELETAAAHATDLLDRARTRGDGSALPEVLRVPKGRLTTMSQCERRSLADVADVPDTDVLPGAVEGRLRGVALDHYVAHQLVAGRVREPLPDLVSMLEAWGADDTLAELRSLDPGRAEAVLGPLAAEVADRWADVAPAWAPRTQSRAVIALDEGRAVTSGIVDVELGGGDTGRPAVVVEVKSGSVTHAHQAEVYLYALMVALRDRRAPAVAARWYPGADPVGVPVTLGVLEAAARRLGDGLVRWAELLSGQGAGAVVSPGPWCGWCPDPSCDRRAVPAGGPTGDG